MSGYVPLPAPVTADPNFWKQGVENLNALRDQQAKQASADAYRQSMNPDGTVNTPKYNALIASGPGAWNAGSLMRQQGEAAGAQALAGSAQADQAQKVYNFVAAPSASLMNDPSDANLANIRQQLVTAGAPPGVIAEVDRLKTLSEADRRTIAYQHNLSAADAQHRLAAGGFPAMSLQNTGGQIEPMGAVPASPYSRGGVVGGTGSVSITPTPGEAMQGGYHYPATQADVDAGRATSVGQDILLPGIEVYKRTGLPIPPGLQGGGGGGGGVVGADGKPVGPDNPPRVRQLNVPNQPPPATPTPGGYQGTGTGTAADTTPIYQPPAGTPPAAPAVPQQPPPANQPPAPTAAQPGGLLAAAAAQAKASGRPVALPTGGSVLPNGNFTAGSPPGTVPLSAPPGPRASLEGGVPVASANALQAPTVGAPGPPSPLVPGDVNAIMQGRANARATPAGGTQTAFNTIATGPGTEEAQGYKTSADKLAADDLAATEWQSTKLPYVEALKNYGEGTKTGPTTDFWNQVAGTIRTPLAKIGVNIGPLADTTERVDALGKWLASIQSTNPVSAKSDAELAQVLKGSASTHINEVAGEDMVKAGFTLRRMGAALNNDWHNNPALQTQYGTYLRYLGDMNNKIDPRAFSIDMLNDAQKARLRSSLQSGSEADAARFEASLALARRSRQVP